jgi:hypothetical protein
MRSLFRFKVKNPPWAERIPVPENEGFPAESSANRYGGLTCRKELQKDGKRWNNNKLKL